MRIIAGRNKGALIAAPRGDRTRPTADRVREALFSMLGDVSGDRVLDLFAGSGALALEALSRGATEALLIDSRPAAAKTIEKNITKLKARHARLARRDYLSILKDAAKKQQSFDLIFVDPPYRMHPVIDSLLARWLPGVAAPGARIVVESDARQEVPLPFQLAIDRVYGDTRIRIYLAGAQAPARGGSENPENTR